jgi:LPS sulfotransferase NodH
VPLTVVYEDFVADYYGTVRRVLNFLRRGQSQNVTIAPPFYERLADEVSEEWVQRFRKERQEGWKTTGW